MVVDKKTSITMNILDIFFATSHITRLYRNTIQVCDVFPDLKVVIAYCTLVCVAICLDVAKNITE